jgi:hypothetical protein
MKQREMIDRVTQFDLSRGHQIPHQTNCCLVAPVASSLLHSIICVIAIDIPIGSLVGRSEGLTTQRKKTNGQTTIYKTHT